MTKKTTGRSQLKGDVFLLNDGQYCLAAAQVDLLAAIDDCGSISSAAKQVGISYKTAWDRIDAMNNMSSRPLVVRAAGGAKGGGTVLTELGRGIVTGFQLLQREHQRFVDRLGRQLHSLTDIADFVKGEAMQSSARNQFRGHIVRIVPGAVNAEVALDIGADQPLIAIITQDSVERLQLVEGGEVVALIKASSVIISTDINILTSARNKLVGRVSRLIPGAVNTDITIDLGKGKSVAAIVTNTSARELGLELDQVACAIFKAPSVVLLKDA
ncbi:MAG: TOBE domain-containing protein [Parahaliea sp.]